MHKRRLATFLATMLAVFAQSPSHSETAHDTAIPVKVHKPDSFAVAPWVINSSSQGDLNKDGLADVALIISRDGNGSYPENRKLIVALKRKDGSFEKVVDNESATALMCGPSGGIPQVEIKKGVLTVSHYCGSRERYEYWHKYQLRNEQWLLIGYTAKSYDSLQPDDQKSLDLNTMTGEVSCSYNHNKKSKHERILELWASPISMDEPSPSDWGAPAVRLQVAGKPSPVVTIQAVHSKKQLFVKTQMEGGTLVAGDITLSDAKGNPISPDYSRTTIYGYIVSAYDLKNGHLHELLTKIPSDQSDEPLLRLTVSVKNAEAPSGKLSTGGKCAGAIFLSRHHGAPQIQDIDMRNGDWIHPFICDTRD